MAVAFDAASSNGSLTVNDMSWTHTPVGTPRAVIVFIFQGGSSADTVNGVTYGGVAMSEVTGSPLLRSAGVEVGGVYAYFLGASIPTGAQTVAVDSTGSGTKQAECITLTGSNDTELVDVDATTNSTSAANPSVTLSLGGRDCWCGLVYASGVDNPANVSPLTDWTAILEPDVGASTGGFYRYNTVGTADVTAGYTAAADDATMIALAVAEVAGGGGGTTRRRDLLLLGVGA
jgi:hypothetical protein